jgi:hypothetical protein
VIKGSSTKIQAAARPESAVNLPATMRKNISAIRYVNSNNSSSNSNNILITFIKNTHHYLPPPPFQSSSNSTVLLPQKPSQLLIELLLLLLLLLLFFHCKFIHELLNSQLYTTTEYTTYSNEAVIAGIISRSLQLQAQVS